MTLVEKIDIINEQIQTQPLSTLLAQILPIALECNDFEGYCLFACWNKPVCKDKATNRIFLEQIVDVLQQEKVDIDEARSIVENAHEKYILLRTVDKEKVLLFSAKEMEDKIKGCGSRK